MQVKSNLKKLAKTIEHTSNTILARYANRRIAPRAHWEMWEHLLAGATPGTPESLFNQMHLSSLPETKASAIVSQLSLSHMPGNAGDVLISYLQKIIWQQYLKQGCLWQDVYHLVQKEDKDRWNKVNRGRLLLVGPGGLFSGAPWPNRSGWFLNLTQSDIDAIRAPIVVFGAGVNHWRQKRPFTDLGKQNIIHLVEKCKWIGLRETAGIEFLKQFIPQSMHYKIYYQPCPSLNLKYLNYEKVLLDSPYVAINIARDQLIELPVSEKFLVEKLNHVLIHIKKRDLHPIFWCAGRDDYTFVQKYFKHFPALLLSAYPGSHLPHIVSRFRFAIGMRMHGVFPFLGMGIPAIAIFGFPIRADVMRRDLDLNDWLCDWSNLTRNWDNIDIEIQKKIDYILDNESEVKETAQQIPTLAWDQTLKNLDRITTFL